MSVTIFRPTFAFLAVICLVCQVRAEDISVVSCDPNADGTATCQAKAANTLCKVDKCSCVDNYIFKTDKSACTKTVMATTCDPNGDGTDCSGLNANAECDSTSKCMCKAGYSSDPDTADSCMKDTAVGKACTVANDCAADANSECTDDTCSCKADYMEVESMCEKILGQACTSTNAATVCKVGNSECKDDACKCMTGYKEKTAMCAMVLETDCSADSECNVLANAACTNKICECTADYAKDGVVCKLLVGKTCTADAECLSNAKCTTGTDRKCACNDDFEASDDKSLCKEASNGAGMMVVPFILLVASVFLASMNIY